jgi:hypothetical protein
LALSPSPHSCESRNLLPQPLDPSTSGLFSRFSRVKGSGTFSLDEFCALTGIPQTRSVKILRLGEKQGIILCLASGFYLLKATSHTPQKRLGSWRPPRAQTPSLSRHSFPLKLKSKIRTLIVHRLRLKPHRCLPLSTHPEVLLAISCDPVRATNQGNVFLAKNQPHYF